MRTARNGMRRLTGFKRPRSTNARRSFRGAKKPSYRGGGGITTQHDRTNVYRKKRMPSRKRRIWKRFTQKVHAVAEKELGARTALFSSQIFFENTDPNAQGQGSVALYGARSTDQHLNDLATIATLENQGSATAAAGGTIDKTTKWMFQSGVLDLTIRNTSGQSDGAINSQIALELDIYDISSPMQWDGNASEAGLPNLQAIFAQSYGQTKDLDADGLSIGIEAFRRGATPFEANQALSRYRLRINSKKKYFLPAGGTLTYQTRDPKRHVIQTSRLERLTGSNLPGWTRNLYFVFKAVPGIAVTTETRERITIGITRKYLYKIEGFNDTRDRYIN